MMPMFRTMLLALATTVFTGCLVGVGHDSNSNSNSDGTITIDNGSSYVIREIRVTAIGNPDWGPNLLADVLYPDEQMTVSVGCDVYDVLVSDEHTRDCTLGDVNLCFSDKIWTIDNATLRSCNY